MLVKEAIEHFETLHLSTLERGMEAAALLRRHSAPFLERELASITKLEILTWHRQIGATRPAAANKALKYLRQCIRFCQDAELYTDRNPTIGIKHFRTIRRKRVVQPGAEMRRLLESLAKEDVMTQCYFLTCLHTGLRRNEARKLRWVDVDLTTGRGTIPRAKGGKPYSFTLPAYLRELLGQLIQETEWIFHTWTGHHWGVSKVEVAWSRVRARAGMDDLWIHDLRRTFASWLQDDGVHLDLIRDALNHTQLRTTEIYLDGLDRGHRLAPAVEQVAEKIQHHAPDPASVPAQPRHRARHIRRSPLEPVPPPPNPTTSRQALLAGFSFPGADAPAQP